MSVNASKSACDVGIRDTHGGMTAARRGAMSTRRLAGFAMCALVAACGNDTAGDDGPPPDPSGLRFYEDVAPVLADHCVTCHRPGGAAPFSLITLDDVLDAAPVMADAVSTRKMPPYGADNSGSCNTFAEARWLSDAEIKTIVDWLGGARLARDP